MRVTSIKVAVACLALALLLAATIFICLGMGAVSLPISQVFQWMRGSGADESASIILTHYRLPRILVAGCVGAALGLCGTVFQGILRNPLAEPFVLGVSGGAACGACVAVTLGMAGSWHMAAAAFAGAVATVFLVVGIARREGRMETATLVLTGVMVNAFCGSVIMYVIFTTTDQKLHDILFWLYGDLSGTRLSHLWLLLPAVATGAALVMAFSRHLNLLAAGDEAALHAGMAVERVKVGLFFLMSLLCGVTVSIAGVIGFAGLMVPHITRMALGYDHRMLVPCGTLFGAIFLIAADTAARVIIRPAQLPVGVVTAFLGAPFFLLLLMKKGSRWW
ncbi:MAG: FecCD family ABC transporter permease [Desulfatibacillaceae bacterium]